MSFVQKVKDKELPNPLADLLNKLLVNTIDFKLSAKQAHWNVKGSNFIALHELFDKVSGEVEGYADMLAERIVQLDEIAQGTLETVSDHSVLAAYPRDIRDGADHVRALVGAICVVADAHRQAINMANDAKDMVTADLCTQITRGLDKLHWLLRSHLA